MNYTTSSHFRKAARQLSNENRKRLALLLQSVEAAQTLSDLPNCKEMQGKNNKGYFRIRFGDYRLGFKLQNDNTLFLIDVGPRGDFYNRFPWPFLFYWGVVKQKPFSYYPILPHISVVSTPFPSLHCHSLSDVQVQARCPIVAINRVRLSPCSAHLFSNQRSIPNNEWQLLKKRQLFWQNTEGVLFAFISRVRRPEW